MIDTTELVNYLRYRDGTLTIQYPMTKHGYRITGTQAIRLEDGKPTESRTWPARELTLFKRMLANSTNALLVADRVAVPLPANAILTMSSRFGTFQFVPSEIANV